MIKIVKSNFGSFLIIILVMIVTGWIFAGWPQIWQNPPIPPDVKKVEAASWLSDWDKRIKVTADHTKVDSDLTWFPLTIRLGTSVGKTSADVSAVFDELTSDANRKKIAVTKTDGTTELYVEIEQWDDANEVAVLHCGLDGGILDADADTDYYLYYDVDHSDNTDYVGDTSDDIAENVWDANFKTVQHMEDATTSTILDSTQYDNHGTKDSANQPATASGKIGNAQHFNGSSDWITLAENGSLDITGTITLEVWVRFDVIANTLMPIIQKRVGSASNYGMRKGLTGQTWSSGADELDLENYGAAWCIKGTDAANLAATTWYHIVETFNNTTHLLYKNGTSIAISTIYGTCPQNLTVNNAPVELGAFDEESNWLDGIFDEARISDSIRNAAWVKASYNSGSDTLLTYGSEETSNATPTVDSIDISPSPITLNADTTKTVTITATITDNNGCEDVFTDGSIAGVFYDAGAESDSCTTDDNDCYPSLTLTEVGDTCTGAGDYTADASVDVPVWFIANPSASWTAKVTATDAASASDSDTSTATINALIAFKLDSATIPYGTIDPDEVSAQQVVLITTTGNAAVDVQLSGTNLTWSENEILVGQQKYSSSSDFDWETQGTALTGTPYCHELSTGKPTAHPSNQSENIYWKLKVPLGKLAGGPYTGTNGFDVVSDTTCP